MSERWELNSGDLEVGEVGVAEIKRRVSDAVANGVDLKRARSLLDPDRVLPVGWTPTQDQQVE